MTRHLFGGSIADFGIDVDEGGRLSVGSGTVTFWNARQGGVQYTDLTDLEGNPTDYTTASAGTDGWAAGQFVQVYGPHDIKIAWASLDGGPRALVISPELALHLAPLVTALETALAAHLQGANPHAMRLQDLTDVASTAPADGQIPTWRAAAGRYVPSSVAGTNPDDFVRTVGGSTISLPEGDDKTSALHIRIPAGDRANAANSVEVWWNAGTATAPKWQLVTRLNEFGELRGQPSAPNRVFGRIKQANPTQTADLWQFTDWNNKTLSWVDAAGRIKAPNLATVAVWHQDKATVGAGTYPYYNPTDTSLTLRGFILSAGGPAPAGDLIIDPKLDGEPIYTPANRPRLAGGQRTSGLATALSATVWRPGAALTVDVVEVPATPPTKVVVQGVAY